MNWKTPVLLILFSFLQCEPVFADVFPPYKHGGLAFSLEVIGSYELSFESNLSLLAWGGFAAVGSIEQVAYVPIIQRNFGPEISIEFRNYFHQNENKKWAVSLYTGIAYDLRYQYGAFTPGIKMTRKKAVNTLLQLEPYLSISYPFYFDGSRAFIPYLTIGYRLVFEKLRK